MRVMWLSNAPWAGSGYGEQTAQVTQRLQAAGHQTAISCNWGMQGAIMQWEGMDVYPADGSWGNTSVWTHARVHDADTVICLCDAFTMHPSEWPDEARMAIWAPVDHQPIPPPVGATLIDDKVQPIAMSKFGFEQMNKMKMQPLYVPHGIDTQMFTPRPELREQARDLLGIPRDAFLVGMVAANKSNPAVPRKSFPKAFRAFSNFAGRHKDAWMYVHSDARPRGVGMNLDVLATVTECPQRIRFPAQDIWDMTVPRETIAMNYAAFDVLLAPSMGEGFGIPIVEAQACGVPVIVSDHSAMTELCGAGWLVDGDEWWDQVQSAFFFDPFISSIEARLEEAYEARNDRVLREDAREFALQYDADKVFEEFWTPALERLGAPQPATTVGLNRATRRQLAKSR